MYVVGMCIVNCVQLILNVKCVFVALIILAQANYLKSPFRYMLVVDTLERFQVRSPFVCVCVIVNIFFLFYFKVANYLKRKFKH